MTFDKNNNVGGKMTKLRDWINDSNNIVFFGGAGTSTESGIPDFRSQDGLYNLKYDYPPETILSHSFFMENPREFYKFYRDKILNYDAKPNMAHNALAKLEEMGKLKAIITQNIDGLHQAAGSKEVIEIHGSIEHNTCMKCHKKYGIDIVKNSTGVPRCSCGGIIKPDVVLYEESLDSGKISKAINYIQNADVLIVGGTSLVVYPAAGFIDYYNGNKLVLINKSETAMDYKADLIINDSISKVLENAIN